MGTSSRKLLQLLVEHDPASPEFRDGVRASLHSDGPDPQGPTSPVSDALWRDVFVQQELPWTRFLQSALLHGAAVLLIWALSLAWLRQQKIIGPMPFDRSSVITYSPNEYLPPLDTGRTEAAKPQSGDPVFAKQPILSVPREADNRSQTIVVPPDVKLAQDVPLPNLIATGAIAPAVPLDATDSLSRRAVAPDQQVVKPAPEVDFAHDRIQQAALKSSIIPPPPDLTSRAKGDIGVVNIGPSDVIAPAPQLTIAEQHALYSRHRGGDSPSAAPVAPPPSMNAGGDRSSQGRLVALGIHPVAPTGPVAVPSGNRRGAFSATPQGRQGATGTPDLTGSKSAANGSGSTGRNSSLPQGLRVGAASGSVSSIERNGGSTKADDTREVASLPPGNSANRRAASEVSDDKITDVDRQVFGDRRPYAMTLNMPNLNSYSGSWVMRFAELQPDPKHGELLAPVPTEKSDPGYPLELMRANVHGTVTLYAVIRSDGRIGDIRVLGGPDRLAAFAADALSRWKFLPAVRAGKAVPIEAVVLIPFHVHREF